MVKQDIINDVRSRQYDTNNIRNICVIAHVDHGKSTLTDSLIHRAGLISKDRAGIDRFMDTRPDEQDRTITIKSTAVSLPFDVAVPPRNPRFNPNWPNPKEEDKDEKHEDDEQDEEEEQPLQTERYLVNLIDSPGHVDFSSEVTAALRVTDGALVVVDCVEGVRAQTCTVLRQAITECIKPVLFLNKLDRVFLELNTDPEEAYQTLARTIESVNVVIGTYHDELLGDVTVYPQAGTVGFGSGLHGWGFTLYDFAKMYHNKLNMPIKKVMKKLWGDHFFDPKSMKFTTERMRGNVKLDRAFVALVLKPIRSLFAAIQSRKLEDLELVLTKLKLLDQVKLKDEAGHLIEYDIKAFGREIMQKWLPASTALLRLITQYLPSPVTAQKYRVQNLYEGPMDDAAATAIRACDAKGELVIFVSKMVPNTDKTRFFALGRVFSGTVSPGQQVRFQGPDFMPGKKVDLHVGRIQNTMLMMGPYVEGIGECPAGNIVGLVGVDNYLMKSGTITTLSDAHNIVPMKYSVAPIVRVAVKPVNPAQMPKLIQGLTRLARSDPLVQCFTSANGEQIIAGCGELHLEVCLKDLRDDFMDGCPINVTDPVVPYRETVAAVSSQHCLAKSANGHNRVIMTAEPLGEAMCKAVEEHVIEVDPRNGEDLKKRHRQLANDFKWDPNDAKKLWKFGAPPDGFANVLVDVSKGVQNLHEVKDSVCSAFDQVSMNGIFTGEPLRGVRFNLQDMKLHSDSAHRNTNQITPAAKQAMYAAQIAAQTRIQEPMFRCEISTPKSEIGGVFQTLRKRRAVIKGVVDSDVVGSDMCTVESFLPVMMSFGFTDELRKNTGGEAFPQLMFSHWEDVEGDVYDTSSLAHVIVKQVRERKGMKPELPQLGDYHQKL